MKKCKIFVLEDSHHRINRFRQMFSPNMCDLMIAKSVEEAFVMFKKPELYFLIFLDYDLETKLTGIDFIQKYKNGLLKHPRIIVHSVNFLKAKEMIEILPNATYMPFVGEIYLKDFSKF